MAEDDAAVLALRRQVQSLTDRLSALEAVLQVGPAGVSVQTAGNLEIVAGGRFR